ncbi:MAG: transposase (plasmid) [Candidatus Methanoperedens sp.]|nr:MAG: transposase [Candidatus Methanoperedens sp.]
MHIFFKYPPKYSLSFIAKRLKGRTSRNSGKNFPISRNGAANICGRRVVFMEVWGRGGRW